jgi:hypothetical protein
MQTLQSQLGKSLSLQLLMTVPRRIVSSDGPAWLQVKALNFLQLLRGSLFGANPRKFPRRFKSLGACSAMQQRHPLGYNPLV